MHNSSAVTLLTGCTEEQPACKQGSAVTDRPVQRAASRRTCCKQVRWTLSSV